MRIGIDISQIIYKSGVSRYTKELVVNLLKLDEKAGFVLFGSSLRQQKNLRDFTSGLEPKNHNLKPKLYPIPPTILEFLFNRFRFPIDNFIGKVDVFHSSDWTQPKTKAKKVTTIHDLAPLKFPDQHRPKIVEVHRRRLELVKKEVDRIIAVSANTKKDLIELLKIPEDKIVVIYEAASAGFEPKDEREQERVKDKLGIKKDYILTVVTSGARKNLTKLFEAFDILKKDFDLSLVIIGNNQGADRDDVVTCGFLEDNYLAALYSGAKVFVYPSVYEGFGLPVIEAMVCGTPVVCSDASSLPEVGGQAAVYVDPNLSQDFAKAIKNVAENSQFRRKLVELGYNQAQKFSWQDTARQTLRVYQSLI